MVAGLQIYIQGGSLGLIPRRPEGKYFGMGLARLRMKSFANNLSILNNDRPHHGIGRCPPRAFGG